MYFGKSPAVAPAENIVYNGDFEDITDWGDPGTTESPKYWPPSQTTRVNPAAQQSGVNAIGGSGTSAYMPAGSGMSPQRDMQNWVGNYPGDILVFKLDFDFASEDLGSDGDRSLNGSISVEDADLSTGILFRVADVNNDGVGDLQLRDGMNAVWLQLPELQASVTFDNDVTIIPIVNHITFFGHYSGSDAYYDVTVVNAFGQEFTATGLKYYSSNVGYIDPGGYIEALAFSTFLSTGDFLVDNVEISNEYVPMPGDANIDGSVDELDAAILASNWLMASGAEWGDGDFNDDKAVNDIDATIMATNWTGSATVAVPEPGMLVILAGMMPLLLMACKRTRQ